MYIVRSREIKLDLHAPQFGDFAEYLTGKIYNRLDLTMRQRDIKRLRPLEHVCSHNSRTNDTLNRYEGVITGAPRSRSMRDACRH